MIGVTMAGSISAIFNKNYKKSVDVKAALGALNKDLTCFESWDALAILTYLAYECDTNPAFYEANTEAMNYIFSVTSMIERASVEKFEQFRTSIARVPKTACPELTSSYIEAFVAEFKQEYFIESVPVCDIVEGWFASTETVSVKRETLTVHGKKKLLCELFATLIVERAASPAFDYLASHLLALKLREKGYSSNDIARVAVLNANWIGTAAHMQGLSCAESIMDEHDSAYASAQVDMYVTDARKATLTAILWKLMGYPLECADEKAQGTSGAHIFVNEESATHGDYDALIVHADSERAIQGYHGSKKSFDVKKLVLDALEHVNEHSFAVVIVRTKDLLEGDIDSLYNTLVKQGVLASELRFCADALVKPQFLMFGECSILLLEKDGNASEPYTLTLDKDASEKLKRALFVYDLETDGADLSDTAILTTGDVCVWSDDLYVILDAVVKRRELEL